MLETNIKYGISYGILSIVIAKKGFLGLFNPFKANLGSKEYRMASYIGICWVLNKYFFEHSVNFVAKHFINPNDYSIEKNLISSFLASALTLTEYTLIDSFTGLKIDPEFCSNKSVADMMVIGIAVQSIFFLALGLTLGAAAAWQQPHQ